MSYRDSIIEGVESENVEEINDAYKDMIDDLGTSENFKHTSMQSHAQHCSIVA